MGITMYLKIIILATCYTSANCIVGGRFAEVGEFPHQVQLFYKGHFFCGGAIISPYMILTACHCFQVYLPEIISGNLDDIANNLWVVAGTNKLSNSEEKDRVKRNRSPVQFRKVLNFMCHANYINFDKNVLRTEYDLAVIFLKLPLDYSDRVKNIPLPLNPVVINDLSDTVILSGWGETETGAGRKSISKKLKTLQGKISSNCSFLYTKNITESFKALGKDYGEPGRTLCVISNSQEHMLHGDSGGAVLCFNKGDNSLKYPFMCGSASEYFIFRNSTFGHIHTILFEEQLQLIRIGKKSFNFRMKCGRNQFYFSDTFPVCLEKEHYICRKNSTNFHEAYVSTPVLFAEKLTSSSKCSNFAKCGKGQFRCFNGKCINEENICDEEKDCNDVLEIESSDEDNCPDKEDARICKGDSLHYCGPGDRCIPAEWKCDGAVDCFTNASDEEVDACFCFSDKYYFSV